MFISQGQVIRQAFLKAKLKGKTHNGLAEALGIEPKSLYNRFNAIEWEKEDIEKAEKYLEVSIDFSKTGILQEPEEKYISNPDGEISALKEALFAHKKTIELTEKLMEQTLQAKNETINILMNNLLKPVENTDPVENSQFAKDFIEEHRGMAICITDENARLLFVNDVFVSETGYSRKEVIGKKPGEFLRGDETEKEKEIELREAVRKKLSFSGEITNYTKAGKKVICKLKFEPFKYNNQTYFISAAKFENVPEQILVKSEN